MTEVTCLTYARGQKKEQGDAQLRALIDLRFSTHQDYGIILNMLEEYGPVTMTAVLRSEYGVDLALAD